MSVVKKVKGIINDFNQAFDAYCEDFVTQNIQDEQKRLAKKAEKQAHKAQKANQP